MRTRRARAERSGRGCDGARVGAQPALGEDLARGSFALAAASRDTEAVPELVEGLRPELRALTDLAVGDGVADADVHGEPLERECDRLSVTTWSLGKGMVAM